MHLRDVLSPDRLATSKDGRAVRLRSASKADLASIVELERAVVAAGEGVVRTLDDIQDARAAQVLSERIGSGLWIVAEWADGAGTIIGCSRLDQHKPSLIRHVATFSVDVHPDAQGLGIGRLLVSCVLDLARTPPPDSADVIRRVELYVRADNARARKLYESVGFVVEGVRRAFVRLPDGRVVDDLVMAMLLPDR